MPMECPPMAALEGEPHGALPIVRALPLDAVQSTPAKEGVDALGIRTGPKGQQGTQREVRLTVRWVLAGIARPQTCEVVAVARCQRLRKHGVVGECTCGHTGLRGVMRCAGRWP